MKAKFVNESIEDVLKAKPTDKTLQDLSELSQEEKDKLLISAAWNDNIKNLELLIKSGANINFKDEDDGFDALNIAAYNNNKEMFNLLKKYGANES